ncbi:MAG TPA: citramalate synthase, partial [Actinomycetota bacterium]|nr:citramalate synthase [Actinomycetota bacterium]
MPDRRGGHEGERPWVPQVELYDTTLRDGAQRAGLSFSVEDKLKVLHALDSLGVPFVEGGWPGANPRDTEFFRLAAQAKLERTTLSAFGMTRKAGERADQSAVLRELLDAQTPVVCLVGKSSPLHVTLTLETTPEENLHMVADSIAFLVREGRRVFFDAEHFFDGFVEDPTYALQVLRAAEEAGATRLVLCDTNGGTLTGDAMEVVGHVAEQLHTPLGVHFHNDAASAVASSVMAVQVDAFQVQGTINGYGERCGNADLVAIAANLALKLGLDVLPDDGVERLTEIAHLVAEIANLPPDPHQPYVGRSAFAHKAGLHASALARRSDAYEHVPPDSVGNASHVLVSDLAGRANLLRKAAELRVPLEASAASAALTGIKEREAAGYAYEAADASLELLLRRTAGWEHGFFEVESFRVSVEERRGSVEPAEATVKVRTNGDRHIATAEGAGPVGALDNALRQALAHTYPELDDMHLTDYRVRVLDGAKGTQAVVRVLIETSDGSKEWTTVGVSDNVIHASWEALT